MQTLLLLMQGRMTHSHSQYVIITFTCQCIECGNELQHHLIWFPINNKLQTQPIFEHPVYWIYHLFVFDSSIDIHLAICEHFRFGCNLILFVSSGPSEGPGWKRILFLLFLETRLINIMLSLLHIIRENHLCGVNGPSLRNVWVEWQFGAIYFERCYNHPVKMTHWKCDVSLLRRAFWLK